MNTNIFTSLVTVDITIGSLENDPVDKFEIIEHSTYSPVFNHTVIKGVTNGAISMKGSEGSYSGAASTYAAIGWFWPDAMSWFGRYVPDSEFDASMLLETQIRYAHNPSFRGLAGDVFDVYTHDGVKITFKLTVDIGECNYCGFCYTILNGVYFKYATIAK